MHSTRATAQQRTFLTLALHYTATRSKTFLFMTLDTATLASFAEHCSIQCLSRGEQLFAQHDTAESMYFIGTGMISLTVHASLGPASMPPTKAAPPSPTVLPRQASTVARDIEVSQRRANDSLRERLVYKVSTCAHF
jgi:hypothetical protein